MKRIFGSYLMSALIVLAMGQTASSDALEAGAQAWLELMDAHDSIRWDHQPGVKEAAVTQEKHERKVMELAEAFWTGHPDDPRRLKAALFFLYAQPLFAQSFPDPIGPEGLSDYLNRLPRDLAAREKWEKTSVLMVTAILRDPHSTRPSQEAAEYALVLRKIQAALLVASEGRAVEWGGLQSSVDAHLDKYAPYPETHQFLAGRTKGYLSVLAENVPDTVLLAACDHFASSAIEPVQAVALAARRIVRAKIAPLEMKFTALDGRQVDLAKMRGKVVLIDFWATWCGPCKAELPNLKQVYAAYHERGFEVLGIALDAERDRAKLEDYCRNQDVVWPQYFDGQSWKTRWAVEYGINAIPAMFLLDREGRIVSTNARGERLEPAVRQLLGL